LAEMYPSQRGERISLFTSATYVGRSIAPFLGGYILYSTTSTSDPLYNYHVMYLAVAAAGLAAFIMALLLLAERKLPMAAAPRNQATIRRMYAGWGALAKDRAVLAVSFVQVSLYYSFGIVDYFLSGYWRNTFPLNSSQPAVFSGTSTVFV